MERSCGEKSNFLSRFTHSELRSNQLFNSISIRFPDFLTKMQDYVDSAVTLCSVVSRNSELVPSTIHEWALCNEGTGRIPWKIIYFVPKFSSSEPWLNIALWMAQMTIAASIEPTQWHSKSFWWWASHSLVSRPLLVSTLIESIENCCWVSFESTRALWRHINPLIFFISFFVRSHMVINRISGLPIDCLYHAILCDGALLHALLERWPMCGYYKCHFGRTISHELSVIDWFSLPQTHDFVLIN